MSVFFWVNTCGFHSTNDPKQSDRVPCESLWWTLGFLVGCSWAQLHRFLMGVQRQDKTMWFRMILTMINWLIGVIFLKYVWNHLYTIPKIYPGLNIKCGEPMRNCWEHDLQMVRVCHVFWTVDRRVATRLGTWGTAIGMITGWFIPLSK